MKNKDLEIYFQWLFFVLVRQMQDTQFGDPNKVVAQHFSRTKHSDSFKGIS